MTRILFIDDEESLLRLVKRAPDLAKFDIKCIHYDGIQYGPEGDAIVDALSGNNMVISTQDQIICDGLNWAWKLVYESVHDPSRFTLYSSNEDMLTEARAKEIPAKFKDPVKFVNDLVEICDRYMNLPN